MKVCGICTHKQRVAIDEAIVAQTPLRAIAGQHGVSRSALDRHKQHVPKALAEAKQAVVVAEAGTLLQRVETLISRCERIGAQAESDRQWGAAVSAARELRACLELIAKVTGELKPASTSVKVQLGGIESLSFRDLSDTQLDELWSLLIEGQELEPQTIEATLPTPKRTMRGGDTTNGWQAVAPVSRAPNSKRTEPRVGASGSV